MLGGPGLRNKTGLRPGGVLRYTTCMKRYPGSRDWLPLSSWPTAAGGRPEAEPTGEAFQSRWIDFDRGIRVGNLEPYERITQILKYHLERRYATAFITDRWGRGVYWQWICWLPRANRQAKPYSNRVNFGCAKLFIAVDKASRLFKSGLQVERGYAAGRGACPGTALQEDWDWLRLLAGCRKGSALDVELARLLLEEGFTAEIGDWEQNEVLGRDNFSSAARLRTAARRIPPEHWGAFQLYYPLPGAEVRRCSGYELVRAVRAVFTEVIPAMNLCMQVPLVPAESSPRVGGRQKSSVSRPRTAGR